MTKFKDNLFHAKRLNLKKKKKKPHKQIKKKKIRLPKKALSKIYQSLIKKNTQ